MLKIWLIVASAAIAVHCGTIQRTNIPVEVRYDREVSPSSEVKIAAENAVLEESAKPEKQEEIDHPNPLKNLDEKVQLSRMELKEVLKHLPEQSEVEIDIPAESTRNEMLGEIKKEEGESSLSLVQRAHSIVKDGIQSIRDSIKHLKNSEEHPTEEQWQDLEKSLNTYFDEEKVRASTDLKQQNQQNIFQNIFSNVQNMTGSFIQNFQAQISNTGNGNGTQNDEQPNVVGQFINNFNSGVQNIQSSIANVFNPGATTSSTNLGDNPVTPGNIFTGFVSNIQQFINGNQGNNNSGNNTQSDESGTTAAPSGPLQIINNVQGQIGNAINSFVQTINPNPRPSGGNQSDESPSGPFQGIQQVGNQIGTAINNFINGGTRPPPSSSSGDDPSTQAPPANVFQGTLQNVGNAFQNFISGGQNAIQQIAGGASGTNNPVVSGAQQIGQQIQTAVTGNPIQTVQGAIQGGAKNPAEVSPEASAEKPKETEKKEEIMLTAE